MFLFILMIIFGSCVQHDINKYRDNFNCYEAMSIVHQKDANLFGCDNKYLEYGSNITELVVDQGCPLDSVRTIWDDSQNVAYGAGDMGCINTYCCDAALYYVKSKYDYLTYFTLITAILGIINYTTLVSLITFLQLYTLKRLVHDIQEKIFLVLLLLVSVGTILFLIIGVHGPRFFPELSLPQKFPSLSPVYIENRFVYFDGYFDIFNVIIQEDDSPCGILCNPITYNVELSVNNGMVRFNPAFANEQVTILQNRLTTTGGYTLQF